MTDSGVHVLIIDDDHVDVMTIKRAFQKSKIANPLIVATDGIEAMEMLKAGRVPRPFVILLDVKMPRMSGHEFLDALRADEELSKSVVFMLTTSDSQDDKDAAYSRHVAGYIVKQYAGDGFLDLVQMLDHYWNIVEVPVN